MSSIFPDTPRTLLEELAREGELDELKWRRFYELYRPVVSSFINQRFGALADNAEDVTQEVMIRLVDVLRQRRYHSDKARFRTYLAALVHNCAVDAFRKAGSRREVPLSEFDLDDLLSGSVADDAATRLDRQWAESCYAAARRHVLERFPLDPVHKKIFLATEKGVPMAAIAADCDISAAAVRQIKHRVSELILSFCREYADHGKILVRFSTLRDSNLV